MRSMECPLASFGLAVAEMADHVIAGGPVRSTAGEKPRYRLLKQGGTVRPYTASVSDVKSKSRTLTRGATIPADARTGSPTASSLFNTKNADSLKRKFLIALVIFP